MQRPSMNPVDIPLVRSAVENSSWSPALVLVYWWVSCEGGETAGFNSSLMLTHNRWHNWGNMKQQLCMLQPVWKWTTCAVSNVCLDIQLNIISRLDIIICNSYGYTSVCVYNTTSKVFCWQVLGCTGLLNLQARLHFPI